VPRLLCFAFASACSSVGRLDKIYGSHPWQTARQGINQGKLTISEVDEGILANPDNVSARKLMQGEIQEDHIGRLRILFAERRTKAGADRSLRDCCEVCALARPSTTLQGTNLARAGVSVAARPGKSLGEKYDIG